MSRLRRIPLFCIAALLLVFAAAALGAGNGLYRGSVVGDTGKDLRVKVKDGRVTKFLANVDANCGFADLAVSVVFPPVGADPNASIKIRSNNTFRKTFVGNPAVPDDIRTITGRFEGSKVTGTIKVVGPCTAEDEYEAQR